jgi:XTP/dITP diphosphohydrolase
MNILLASNNTHNGRSSPHARSPHTIILPKELGLSFEFEEDKPTFTENALGTGNDTR